MNNISKDQEIFLTKLGQTTPSPYLIEIERAKGIFIYDKKGKGYMDMIAGVAVNNIGHNHPKVVDALKEQIDRHLHVMVYGEYVQEAQNRLAEKLIALLPESLDMLYPVNSGTEANEAAIKLVKRVTGRTKMISFKGSYHGSTNGSLSISGNETKKRAFRPLLPDIEFIELNNLSDLERITEDVAGVFLETIQGDAGVRIPSKEFMKALRERCTKTGALLVLDEIQCGLGRTAKMFAFEHFDIVPDVLTLGKALGGGMPVGALVSSKKYLREFTYNPMLGHITTFGGHPVVCAAASACLEVLSSEIDFDEVERIGSILEKELTSVDQIKEIRRIGMMYAFDMDSSERVERVVKKCLERGLIAFWFLSHPYSFRISPPINISENEIINAASIIKGAIMDS